MCVRGPQLRRFQLTPCAGRLADILQRASKFAGQLQGAKVSSLKILDAVVELVLASAEEATSMRLIRYLVGQSTAWPK